MPPRQRQSGASSAARPSASATQVPPYESLKHPLTPAAQNALTRLRTAHQLTSVQNHFKSANDALAECANEIQLSLFEQQETLNRQKKAAENRGEELDVDVERETTEFEKKVQAMTVRMEQQVRKTIDGQQAIKDMELALQHVQQHATSARSQRTQQQSFDPTLPDATQASLGDSQTGPGPGPSVLFTEQVESRREQYQALSLQTRYTGHNAYIGYKKSVHDGMYPNNEKPLPSTSRWFTERGSPMPGTAAVARGGEGGAEDEDSDEDIAIARENISTKCPLTLRDFEDPVTSTICPHTFEKSAIMDLLRSAPRGSGGVQCPVPGCTRLLHAGNLASDQHLIRKIRRLQKARKNAQDDADSDDEVAGPGKNARTSIMVDASSIAGGDDFDDTMLDDEDEDDVVAITNKTAKQEPSSRRTPAASQPPRSSAVGLDLEEDEEAEEEEGETEDEEEEEEEDED